VNTGGDNPAFKFPPVLVRVCRAYQHVINFAGIFLIAAIAIVAGLQVYFRYVVGASLYWSEELMRYMMVWAAFLLAGTAYSRGEMLGFTLLIDLLPPRLKWLALLIGRLVIIAFLAVVVWYGIDFAWRTRQDTATALQISMLGVHGSVAVGSILMILHVTAVQLTGEQEPHTPGEGL
jgi:TRAP-type C4-dicarboxylate transport system permease small subunit